MKVNFGNNNKIEWSLEGITVRPNKGKTMKLSWLQLETMKREAILSSQSSEPSADEAAHLITQLLLKHRKIAAIKAFREMTKHSDQGVVSLVEARDAILWAHDVIYQGGQVMFNGLLSVAGRESHEPSMQGIVEARQYVQMYCY